MEDPKKNVPKALVMVMFVVSVVYVLVLAYKYRCFRRRIKRCS
ncbi:hypothetical protein Q5M85_16800 [Paraclostridium bifermentans]|nr:hypothetical protein [Paraclostridium bifermentans]